MKFSHDGTPVELSKTEQKLLKILTQNMGKTLSREMLIDRVWSDGAEFVEENALSVCVKRLRQKLPGLPVKTVYGIGYVLEKVKMITVILLLIILLLACMLFLMHRRHIKNARQT